MWLGIYLDFLRDSEIVLVDGDPKGVLSDFGDSIDREDFLRLVPDIVEEILVSLAIAGVIVETGDVEVPNFPSVVPI